MKKIGYLLAILALVLNACKKEKDLVPVIDPPKPPVINYVPDNSFKIVAYMPSYKDPATVDISKYKMITHLFYAFLEVNASGDGSLNALSQPTRFDIVRQRAKANNVKFGISIMGAESIFAAIANSATARTKFINNVIDFAKTNNLAGVDIDWEYPRTSGGNANTTFTALMKELSSELHKNNMFLSAAITPAVYASTNRDAIEAEVYQYVDFFNIMQYDGGVDYDSTEPLNHATMKMTDASLSIWLDTKKMPKEKAVLGMPLYGKNAAGASMAYRDIEASGANVNLNIATVNGVDYGFNGITLIKAKTQKAKDRCNGIMFWEFSHDSNTANSLVKAANDQLGRAY